MIKLEKRLSHMAWLKNNKRKTLHCVPSSVDENGIVDENLVDEGQLVYTALCGRTQMFSVPGVFSRMYAPRCKNCCSALKISPGIGTPLNEFKHTGIIQ